MLLCIRKQDKRSTTRIPAAHLRLRTVPGTEWRAGNELCLTVTEFCSGVWIMSFFCKVVVYLLWALPAVAHSQAFPKITIRPSSSADPRNMRMQVLPNGDLVANAVPVIMLLSYAYDVPVDPSPRLSPLPDWTIRERYDIAGKGTANPITPSLQGSDSGTRIQQNS